MRYLSAALILLICGCKASRDEAHTASGGAVHDGESPKGSLGALRSALSIYYGDMEGHYPSDMAALTLDGKYLTEIPKVGPLHIHPVSADIRNGAKPTDEGGWLYDNQPTSANAGNVTINCTHTDAKGSSWTAY